MRARALIVLFLGAALLDLLLCFPQEDTATLIDDETARQWARLTQTVVQIFTLCVSLYCLAILRRWQGGSPRFALMATSQFLLLPE